MPSVIYKGAEHWAYLLPPIAYPDGTTRIKLGGGYHAAEGAGRELCSTEALVEWYRSGGEAAATQAQTRSRVSLLHTKQ